MAKFCRNCGSKRDKKTGLCPKCDAEKIKNSKRNRSNISGTRSRKKKNSKLKWILIFLIGIVMIGGILWTVIQFTCIDFVTNLLGIPNEKIEGSIRYEETEGESGMESYEVIPPDAEDFFSQNSKIISSYSAKTSSDVSTEEDTYVMLEERGFSQYSIITEYSMDGNYSSATEIDRLSEEKHPIYQTDYVSGENELWTVFVINGSIMANPVSFNFQSDLPVQVIISEKDTIMSYDSTTNMFFETIPDKSALIVLQIDKIDAKMLDSLTIGEIEDAV